ncbi:Vacuolar protein sorting-associated protein 53-like protein [Armadillidium nasatum]|uniref:Vacuolar protein sorting-associated protein 53 homolog n=1 Tax=Armadillidium nasatum TaxID=96803 RepID=A0A5N5TMK0_9CRUS|nr:Vacuolar protein sorting-associated protein 53-like protein [Armadillidium nasatum]
MFEILPSNDPFDSPDFNSVDYINEKFPAEQSLHHIDEVLEHMRVKITSIDDEISSVVRSLTNVEQERASESESRVKEITRDIKQLDVAKKNLTSSITTLSHLQMLVEGVDKLSTLKIKREYGEIATLLQGVGNVLDHLTKYRHIPQVADLAGQVEQIRKDLEKQILDDFYSAFHGPNSKRFAPSKELAEACLVVSVLDHRVKKTIIDDIIKTQLAEYEALFAGGEVDGGLNRVEQRRKWFFKTAVEFEKTLAAMFPPSWQVPAKLAYGFCEMTNKQLTQAMQLRQQELDVASILQAHKILSELETLLAKKYSTFTYQYLSNPRTPSSSYNPFEEDEEDSKNPFYKDMKEHAQEPSFSSPFNGAICKCFHPFLHIYLRNVDKRLNEQIDKFAIDMKSYKFEHIDAEASNVVPFCGELFTIYKNVLVEYLRLGSGETLSGLADVMRKHLKEFAIKVLRASLPRLGANIPNMPKDLNMKELTAVLAQVQTLWREGDNPKLSEDDVRKVCSVLVSSEYCEEMTARLDAKFKEKLSSSKVNTSQSGLSTSSSPLSFAPEEDLFHSILTQIKCIFNWDAKHKTWDILMMAFPVNILSIALLVTHVESQCDAALSTMPKLNWTPDQTGDQSPYITGVSQTISTTIPLIRHNLHTSRKYFTRFCDKLATTIINKFVQQIYKCRPLNSVGCEQLLLDCHALKAIMLNLPIVGSRVNRDPPQTYTRMVSRAMSRAELLLQVVMGEYNTDLELVEKFARLLPDASLSDFQKVLELRGAKDKASVLELYRRKVIDVSPEKSQSLSTSSPRRVSSGSTFTSGTITSPERDSSKIARLERLLKSGRLMMS